jgi:hypothetical protein
MQFLYGNNVLKSGLARITENTPAYTGVVIYNMADIPLGFGVTAKSTNECRNLDPNAVVTFHQADCGEGLHRPALGTLWGSGEGQGGWTCRVWVPREGNRGATGRAWWQMLPADTPGQASLFVHPSPSF